MAGKVAEQADYFFLLAAQAGSTGLFLIPAVVLMVVAAIAAVHSFRQGQRRARWRDLPLLLTPLLPAALILACGAVFAQGRFDPPSVGDSLIGWLLLLELPLAVWLVWRMRGLRLATLSLVSVQVWYACLAWLMSHMAITGIWL